MQSYYELPGVTTWYHHVGIAADEATAIEAVALLEDGQGADHLLTPWEDED